MKALTILWLAGLIWGVGLFLPEVNDILKAPLALALALAAALACYLAVDWVFRFIGRYPARSEVRTSVTDLRTRPLAVNVSRQGPATPGSGPAHQLWAWSRPQHPVRRTGG